MTNRKWMLEQNEYDLLMRFNNYMELVATEDWWDKNGRSTCDLDCKACVQKWLNEERR